MPQNGDSGPQIPEVDFDPPSNDPQSVRLLDALLEAKRKLKRLERFERHEEELKACLSCFERALTQAKKERPYLAWGALHEFDWEYLSALDDNELLARWCMLAAEADDKLTGWRHKAGLCLKAEAGKILKAEVDESPNAKADQRAARLALARELLSNLATASQNQQHKLEIFRHQTMPWVSRLLGLVVVTTVSVTSVLWYLRGGEPLGVWAQTIWLGIAGGALGAIVSTAFSVGRTDLKAKIPEMRLTDIVTYTRPLLGAAVAILIAILVKAEYVTIGNLQGNTGVIAACFAGGWSERWFLGLMEGLGGKA